MDIRIKASIQASSKASFDKLWIKYSQYADGTDFVDTWESGYNYIGFAVAYLEPTEKEAYKWSQFAFTVDKVLKYSTNPVQNKVIKETLDNFYVTAGKKYGIVLGEKSTAEGYDNESRGNYSHAEGNTTVAKGESAHSEGNQTQANSLYSHSEGNNTVANRRSQHVFGEFNIKDGIISDDKGVFIEIVGNGTNDYNRSNARTLDWEGNEVLSGKLTIGVGPTNNNDVTTKEYVDSHYVSAGKKSGTVLGEKATAEGLDTTSNKQASHAEGNNTVASGKASHAEGTGTIASGLSAHAEGCNTVANGNYSHTEGYGTVANGTHQHVFGTYNIPNTADFIEIVGNGTDENNLSNARTLDRNGNEILKGKLTVGANPTNPMDVATKQYVDSSPGGGGSVVTPSTITIAYDMWYDNTYTASISGLLTTSSVIVSPSPESQEEYVNYGVICAEQNAGSLLFTCEANPMNDLIINILVIN